MSSTRVRLALPVVGLALLAGVAGFVLGRATEAPASPADTSPASYLEVVTRRLGLRPDQVAALDRLLASEDRDIRALVEQAREVLQEPVAARRQQTEDAMLALLDPSQKERYEALTAGEPAGR